MATCNFIPYTRQHLDNEDREAVLKSLEGDLITRGEDVTLLEENLAGIFEARYAVVFSHGTAAISAAGFAADWGAEDVLITSPNSFIGSVSAALQSACAVTFSDIDPRTGNLDIEKAWEHVNTARSRGKKIFMPVHYAGAPLDMAAFERGVQDPELIIIEDACHALGAKYPSGEFVGSCSLSNMTVFSLHPAKTITMGEGGCVLTNEEQYYERLLQFRNNGIVKEAGFPPWYYEVRNLTGNYNVTSFQAALANSQIPKLFTFVEKRRRLVECYRKHLEGTANLKLLPPEADAYSAHHLFVCLIENADRVGVMQALKEEGIGTQVHFIPLYKHPAVKDKLGVGFEALEGMESFYSQALSLPLFYDLTEEDVERICSCLKKLL